MHVRQWNKMEQSYSMKIRRQLYNDNEKLQYHTLRHITKAKTLIFILYRVGQKKPDCFSDLIILWRLVLERRAVCQNFRNFIEKKVKNWHFNEFKYSLPNLLKSSQQLKLCYIWPEHMDFTQFTLTYSETTVIFPQSCLLYTSPSPRD